jgi:hypothetical protein
MPDVVIIGLVIATVVLAGVSLVQARGASLTDWGLLLLALAVIFLVVEF